MSTLTARRVWYFPRVAPISIAIFVALILFATFTQPTSAQTQSVEPGLIAHEWGTFTSIAGSDGLALEWLPLTPSTESPKFVHRDLLPLVGLPGFVYHYNVRGKFGLAGTIRMETPVLYFYSDREMTLSVGVSFVKGLITEWYPKATEVTPTEAASSRTLYTQKADGFITWDKVALEPGSIAGLPRDVADSRYYSARKTASTPLRVSTEDSEEHEKFLFYRGVSAAPTPISARFREDGKLLVKTNSTEAVADVILFERRGDRLGFRLASTSPADTVLETPDLTSTIDTLATELEHLLIDHGLYPDEAHAMLETWNDSWFEEGSRLIYIVPSSYLNAILPLNIHPLPAQTVRVFVGRVELMSPATLDAVKNAVVSHDRVALRNYCRFLWPIVEAIKQKNPGFQDLANQALDQVPCVWQSAPPVQTQTTRPADNPAVTPQPCPVTEPAAGASTKRGARAKGF